MTTTLPVLSDLIRHNFVFDIKKSANYLKDIVHKNSVQDVETSKEYVYRKDGMRVEKIVEYNVANGNIVKITNLDYFNDKKVKSVEEYKGGKLVRFTGYSLFKSVTEYDKISGKKICTTNYQIKNENKISSVYHYDTETEKIVKMAVYRPDGKYVAFVKEISPESGQVVRCINYKKNSSAISSVSKFEFMGTTSVKTTFYYNTPLYFESVAMLDKKILADTLNNRVLTDSKRGRIDKLIDNLYKNKQSFASVKIS